MSANEATRTPIVRWAVFITIGGLFASGVFLTATTDAATLSYLTGFPPHHAAAAIALALIPWLTNSLRNRIWARFFGLPLSYREALRITLAVDVGCAVTPAAAGGAYLKLAMLRQHGLSTGVAACLVTLGTVENAILLFVAIPTAVVLSGMWHHDGMESAATFLTTGVSRLTSNTLVVAAGIMVLVLMIVALVWLSSRLQQGARRIIGRVRKHMRAFLPSYQLILRAGQLQLVQSMTLATIGYVARYSVVSVVLAGIGQDVNVVLYWVLQWIVFTVAGLIPSPGGIGAAEAAFYGIHSPFVTGDALIVAMVLWRFFTFYVVLGIGAALLSLLLVRRGTSLTRVSSDRLPHIEQS